MKKILAIGLLAASLSGISAMAQGYVAFQTPTRGTWDLFTAANNGVPKLGATENVSFLWSSVNVAPLIAGIQTSTSTNSLAANSAAGANVAADWTAIMSDSNFHLGLNAGVNPIVAATSAGAASYQSAASFPLQGSAAGSTIYIYVIGWDKTYATPAAAQAAGSAVGWSSVFSYATGADSLATVNTFTASGFVPFGVVSVPEPATFALAGLGMAAMLISRRRK